MRAEEIIRRKRDGKRLTREEIAFFLEGFTAGRIPDYQMAALAMAVYFRGLDGEETWHWTEAMWHSGETVDLSAIPGVKVDKHSTGGVGDTVTLVLAPLVAAAGAPVVKMSGRGLGHTGGTVDKLESIPGFRSELAREELLEQVRRIGVAVVAQSGGLVPADKKLYALRDVTATVESLPLIASSVMSKKLAAGADAILLDVKCGGGAFMKSAGEARQLAGMMVEIGRRAGRRTMAVITRMEGPLGRRIGNALEVEEAILTLQGRGEQELVELCLELGGRMLLLAGLAGTAEEGKERLARLLAVGEALERFRRWVAAQGGDARVADDPGLLPRAPVRREVPAPDDGFVRSVDAEALGRAAMRLGAGRETAGQPVDPAVGLVLCKKPGEPVRRGDPLAVVHARTPAEAAVAEAMVSAACTLGPQPPPREPLILDAVDGGSL